jgi:hypothetical protein
MLRESQKRYRKTAVGRATQARYDSRRHQRNRERLAGLRDRCVDCGATTDLHFHHRDPTTKAFTIGSGNGRPWRTLEVEIAKCDVLCVVCHDARHGRNQRA